MAPVSARDGEAFLRSILGPQNIEDVSLRCEDVVDSSAAFEEWRARGNTCFGARDYTGAFAAYSRGIYNNSCGGGGGGMRVAALRANRAQAALSARWPAIAKVDAARSLVEDARANWRKKSWHRLAKACAALGEHDLRLEACRHAAAEGLALGAEEGEARRAVAAHAQRHKACGTRVVRLCVVVRGKDDDGEADEGEAMEEGVDGDDDESSSDDDDDNDASSSSTAAASSFGGTILPLRVEELTQTSGGAVWDAAILLAHWLAEDRRRPWVAGRGVVEVGAGCGVVGLACAKLGARQVTLTDFEPAVVDALRAGVCRRAINADAFLADFRRRGDYAHTHAETDLVVGSECVYYDSCDKLATFVLDHARPVIGTRGGDGEEAPLGVFAMSDTRAGLGAFRLAAEKAGLLYERRPFPRRTVQRARRFNRAMGSSSKCSIHLLYAGR